MIGAITLIIFVIGLIFVWFSIKYVGYLFGLFENPMQQEVISGIKLKKEKEKKEVEEEVEEEEVEVEVEKEVIVEANGRASFILPLFLIGVVILILYLVDFNFAKIMEILKLLDSLVIEFFRGIQQILNS